MASTSVAGLSLRRCIECGLYVGAFPEPKETGYSRIDSHSYVDSIGHVRRTQVQSIVALTREHVVNGDWLDVGCGFGYAVEAAQLAGYSSRGIEPNMVAADAALQRGLDVEHGVLTEATPPADVISTLDVLEHLQDINSFAQLVKRKARRLWVIKVPSSDGLFFRIAHMFRITSAVERLWQSRYEHPHRVYFNETALHRFLERHGFEIAATRYLREVPSSTFVDRLAFDGSIQRWKARMAVPLVWAINLVERVRVRSDALLVIARPR